MKDPCKVVRENTTYYPHDEEDKFVMCSGGQCAVVNCSIGLIWSQDILTCVFADQDVVNFTSPSLPLASMHTKTRGGDEDDDSGDKNDEGEGENSKRPSLNGFTKTIFDRDSASSLQAPFLVLLLPLMNTLLYYNIKILI